MPGVAAADREVDHVGAVEDGLLDRRREVGVEAALRAADAVGEDVRARARCRRSDRGRCRRSGRARTGPPAAVEVVCVPWPSASRAVPGKARRRTTAWYVVEEVAAADAPCCCRRTDRARASAGCRRSRTAAERPRGARRRQVAVVLERRVLRPDARVDVGEDGAVAGVSGRRRSSSMTAGAPMKPPTRRPSARCWSVSRCTAPDAGQRAADRDPVGRHAQRDAAVDVPQRRVRPWRPGRVAASARLERRLTSRDVASVGPHGRRAAVDARGR